MVLIRVLLVCPLPALRTGLRVMLNRFFADSRLGAESTSIQIWETGSLADAPVSLAQIDVLILVDQDQSLFDLEDWLDRSSVAPALLLLTDQADVLEQFFELQLPAWGMLSLDVNEDELAAAVLALSRGLIAGSPGLLKPFFSQRGKPQQVMGLASAELELEAALTGREVEVLQLLAQGLPNKQIALELGISENTVKFHVSSIFTRLGAANRMEAVRIGVQHGLISL